MKMTHRTHIGIKVAIAAVAVAAIYLVSRGAETVTEWSKSTTVKTTKAITGILIVPGVVTNEDGEVTGTNIAQIVVNWTQTQVDGDGVVIASASGGQTIYRADVWAATNTTWRLGMTNAWDGQLDALPSRIINLWKRPDYLLPPTP